VAAWVKVMFYNIYLEKTYKIKNNSTATGATGKITHIWNPLEQLL
jgi:hypothetical protein